MADDDGGERASIAEAFLIFVALIGAALALYFIGQTSGINAGRNESYASSEQEKASESVRIKCAGREGPAFTECAVENVKAAYDEGAAQQDLYAQQEMAKWALAMVLVSAIMAGLTLWALIYIRGTLSETRRMAGEATAATRAMVEANKISNRIAEAELRPYLFVDRLELVDQRSLPTDKTDEDGEPIPGMFMARSVVWFRNFGKVPARKVRVYIKEYMARRHEGKFWRFEFSKVAVPIVAPEPRTAGVWLRLGIPDRPRRVRRRAHFLCGPDAVHL